MANAKKIKIGETTYDFKDQSASTSINSLTSRVSSLETDVSDLNENKLDENFYINNIAGIGELTTYMSDVLNAGVKQATVTIGTSDNEYSSTVCDFVCTGSNDNTAFQSAINALPENGGKIVILDGEYTIKKLLTCNKNVIFEGMGDGTIIKFDAESNSSANTGFLNITSAKHIVLRDMKITVGGRLNTWGSGNTDEYFIKGTGGTGSILLIDNCNISSKSTNRINITYNNSYFIAGFNNVIVNNSNFMLYFTTTTASCFNLFNSDSSNSTHIVNTSLNINITKLLDFHLIGGPIINSNSRSSNLTNSYVLIYLDASGQSANIGNCIKVTDSTIILSGVSGISFGNCNHGGGNTYTNTKIRNSYGTIYLDARRVIDCSIYSSSDIFLRPHGYSSVSYNSIIVSNNHIYGNAIKCYFGSTDVIFTNNIVNKSVTTINSASSKSIIKDNIVGDTQVI